MVCPLQPATPVAGEVGKELLQHAWPTAINPRRGGGVEELCAGGGVDDCLGCWSMYLLPPQPRLGGGAVSRGGGWCQGATPRYWGRSPHTMVVNSELMVVNRKATVQKTRRKE